MSESNPLSALDVMEKVHYNEGVQAVWVGHIDELHCVQHYHSLEGIDFFFSLMEASKPLLAALALLHKTIMFLLCITKVL